MKTLALLNLALLLSAPPASGAPAPTYAEVAPILQKHCVVCHRGPSAPRGLELDTYNSVLKGSAGGPVAVAGDPQRSEIVRRLRGQSLPRMPLTGPPYLPEEQIALIERWIAAGMTKGEAPAATPPPAQPRPPGVTYADVEPILLQRCVKCHTDGGVMGPPPEGLRLKTRERSSPAPNMSSSYPGPPARASSCVASAVKLDRACPSMARCSCRIRRFV